MLGHLLPGSGGSPHLVDSHLHTPLCRHAVGSPDAYARRACARGLKGVVFTCHAPHPEDLSLRIRMLPEELPYYVTMVGETQTSWSGRLEIGLGLEVDAYPGNEAWIEEQLTRADFDYVLGSVHPQLPEYRRRFQQTDALAAQTLYFEHEALAAESGLIDAISHPDYIKHLMPEEWQEDRIWDVVCRALDRIAATDVAVELNTAGIHHPGQEMSPGRRFLEELHARGIPIVLGSDAHHPFRVADGFESALRLLRNIDCETVCHYHGRKRQEVAIADGLAGLERHWFRDFFAAKL